MINDYISVSEYAKIHGIDTSTIRHKILKGNFSAVKVGNQWLVKKGEPWVDNRIKKEGEQ